MENIDKQILLGGLKDGVRSPKDYQQGSRVYNSEGIANTLLNKSSTDFLFSKDKMNEEIKYYACASRGRDPTFNNKWIQQLEINFTGFSNTITGVAKDNYILEVLNYKDKKRF